MLDWITDPAFMQAAVFAVGTTVLAALALVGAVLSQLVRIKRLWRELFDKSSKHALADENIRLGRGGEEIGIDPWAPPAFKSPNNGAQLSAMDKGDRL